MKIHIRKWRIERDDHSPPHCERSFRPKTSTLTQLPFFFHIKNFDTMSVMFNKILKHSFDLIAARHVFSSFIYSSIRWSTCLVPPIACWSKAPLNNECGIIHPWQNLPCYTAHYLREKLEEREIKSIQIERWDLPNQHLNLVDWRQLLSFQASTPHAPEVISLSN